MLEVALILLALSSMSSLGLELIPEQLSSISKTALTGLGVCFLNLISLPIIAFLLCRIFGLSPAISLGIFLCACSGGGASAGLFILKAKGAPGTGAVLLSLLNFTSLFTAPLLITLYSGSSFSEIGQSFSALPKLLGIGLLFFGLPLGIGLWIRRKQEEFSRKILPILLRISNISLGFSILYLGIKYGLEILEFGILIWIVLFLLIGISFTSGLYLFREKPEDRRSIGIVSGIRNLSLALLLAQEQSGDPKVLITILLYGFIMYLIAFPASVFWRRWKNVPI
ncbi:bile acid:sodium symporter family protein [Leptospira alstonii]|uniref:Sodium Bile acid symporter family protein n=3 Tax=Leptospira alstonii TaxID=28452 RepID=M6CL42_9LEPT|nr:sodium Bile acid symporter family protein [Leptospira alstonii]EMJ91326.1 sodium Bile acid symporter family protein [Leptospira alstonii serovar Sichuan str. 79601]EQA81969.1 sodium Bile acid symporter family protein [Leptospira alstonii serovar Pingchang str. 80-412]